MAIRDQHIPEPGIKQLMRLQLFRYNLVHFIENKLFPTLIQGCFVRVLLEMRAITGGSAGGDSYYIAMVKGAQKGPAYAGFSWDGMTTEWHIIIDLPPCFRNTPNSNVVQLNSISNSPFKPAEYQSWVQMAKEAGNHFVTIAQIDLRHQMLQEDLDLHGRGKGGRRAQETNMSDEERQRALVRDQQAAVEKGRIRVSIEETHNILPAQEDLSKLPVENLSNLEQMCLGMLNRVREEINNRTKCMLCKNHYSTVVCYPCKHQVLCRACSENVVNCPACNQLCQDKFEPFCN